MLNESQRATNVITDGIHKGVIGQNSGNVVMKQVIIYGEATTASARLSDVSQFVTPVYLSDNET